MPRKKFGDEQLKFYASCDCYVCPGPRIAEDALKYKARIRHLLKYLKIANKKLKEYKNDKS